MKLLFFGLPIATLFMSWSALAQQAVVDVNLTPAGSFKIKSIEVQGYAERNGTAVDAKNISVGLLNIDTGIALRTKHCKKYLETDKFPNAVLVRAHGAGGKGSGIIRIRGVERMIAGTYVINGNKLEASFSLKLSDFKIENVKYMGVGVDDEIKLSVIVPIRAGKVTVR